VNSKLSAHYILLDFISGYLVNDMLIMQPIIHFSQSPFISFVLGQNFIPSLPSFQTLLFYRMQTGAEKSVQTTWYNQLPGL